LPSLQHGVSVQLMMTPARVPSVAHWTERSLLTRWYEKVTRQDMSRANPDWVRQARTLLHVMVLFFVVVVVLMLCIVSSASAQTRMLNRRAGDGSTAIFWYPTPDLTPVRPIFKGDATCPACELLGRLEEENGAIMEPEYRKLYDAGMCKWTKDGGLECLIP
jgi:hypothetical protein